MNGTNNSTGGIRSVTRKLPRWTARLVVYALLVAAALLLLLRFQLSVGRQMAALEREFGDVEAESFYVGVQARSMLRHLDERLLNCLLDQKPTDREAFFKEADELHAWIRKREGSLHTAEERQLFTQIESGIRPLPGRRQAAARPCRRPRCPGPLRRKPPGGPTEERTSA